MTVETAHTFYVGQNGWLVHNSKVTPPTPNNMSDPEFGNNLVKWGTGRDGTAKSLERMQSISDAELKELASKGLTIDMAEQWGKFYEGVAKSNPSNPSAAGRETLMKSIAERMRGLGIGGC